ncbi:NADPH-dependent FMN reductase [Paraflavisolibacter sp. H34]|uniref:NADPH-dependent FMN reductase n=1 Tax=Huijunlia imazamoxiresistens TaxID=3127457 RepID=UPI003015E7B0
MNILIFNGSQDSHPSNTAVRLAHCFQELIEEQGHTVTLFHLSEAGIPFLNLRSEHIPGEVLQMVHAFREADAHIWLAPLYHGSIPGVMKNCLDWLEVSSHEPEPYLTGKVVGLLCWSGGLQAMQGINTMEAVAKALRAWVLPLSLPIARAGLFDEEQNLSPLYKRKLEQMVELLLAQKVGVRKDIREV